MTSPEPIVGSKRSRKQTKRYSPPIHPPRKQQRTLSFNGIPVSATNHNNNTSTPLSPTNIHSSTTTKSRSKRKSKTNSSIKPLEFYVIPSGNVQCSTNKPILSTSDSAKLFNDIIRCKNGSSSDNNTVTTINSKSDSNSNFHPFFSKSSSSSIVSKSKSLNILGTKITTKDSSNQPIVLDNISYSIENTLPPIHINQLSKTTDNILCDNIYIPDIIEDSNSINTSVITNSSLRMLFEDSKIDNYLSNISTNVSVEVESFCFINNSNILLKELEIKEKLSYIHEVLLKQFPNATEYLSSFDNFTLLFKKYYDRKYPNNNNNNKNGINIDGGCIDNSMIIFSMWSELYKPLNIDEYFTNQSAAKTALSWLSFWKNSLSNNNTIDNKENNTSFTSQLQMEDIQNYEIYKGYKALLLFSEKPIGKSSLVYSIAKQLEMKVLEINTSDHRGNRLFNALEEATQSHHLSLHNNNNNCTNNTKNINNTINLSSGNDNNNGILENSSSIAVENHKVILFDDADIRNIDETTFRSNLLSLIDSTKQPIIITCTRVPLDLLSNTPILIQNIGKSTMLSPIIYRQYCIIRHLLLISLIEYNYIPNINDLLCFCYVLNYDLRKILLSLQFWIHPIIQKISQSSKNNNNLLKLFYGTYSTTNNINSFNDFSNELTLMNYDNIKKTILCNNLPLESKYIPENEKNNKKFILNQMNELADIYDSWSFCDTLTPSIYCDDEYLPNYTNNTCRFTYQTDFVIKDSQEELSTEHLFNYNYQGNLLMEKIYTQSLVLIISKLIPQTISNIKYDYFSLLNIDIQSITSKR